MKNLITLIVVLAIIAAGTVAVLKLRITVKTTTAVTAEAKGDYSGALAQYIDALNKLLPSRDIPEVNHSKVFTPPVWKKEVADYVAWLTGTPGGAGIDRAQRNTLIEAATRNAVHAKEENFVTNNTRKKLSEQQYLALWNSVFFSAAVRADTSHRSLAVECYAKKLSFVRLAALTSYVYDVSLLDTAADRRITFSVYPESNTFVLAAPGTHLMFCKSSYQPAPGQLWRSSPTIIPVIVPASPSLVSYTLQTQVVRERGGK
jgi:hypothetical protein